MAISVGLARLGRITSTRAYRTSKPHKVAISILREEAGSQLDPDAVAAFDRRYGGFRPPAAWAFVTQLVPRGAQALLGGANAVGGSAASLATAVAAAGVLAGAGRDGPRLGQG